MLFILMGICVVFVTAQIYFEYQHHQENYGPYVGITKTIASLTFVSVAFVCHIHQSRSGTILGAGLILCLLGDIFLISSQRKFFLLGLISFLLAHMAYCIAFLSNPISRTAIFIALPVLVGVAWFISKWLLPKVDSKMKKPVLAYILTICCMVILAVGASWPHNHWHLAVAAIMFMISDIYVAKDRFIQSTFQNRLLGLPLYYGAQLIFATSHLWSIT